MSSERRKLFKMGPGTEQSIHASRTSQLEVIPMHFGQSRMCRFYFEEEKTPIYLLTKQWTMVIHKRKKCIFLAMAHTPYELGGDTKDLGDRNPTLSNVMFNRRRKLTFFEQLLNIFLVSCVTIIHESAIVAECTIIS